MRPRPTACGADGAGGAAQGLRYSSGSSIRITRPRTRASSSAAIERTSDSPPSRLDSRRATKPIARFADDRPVRAVSSAAGWRGRERGRRALAVQVDRRRADARRGRACVRRPPPRHGRARGRARRPRPSASALPLRAASRSPSTVDLPTRTRQTSTQAEPGTSATSRALR